LESSLGDVVSSVIDSGLQLEHLHEFNTIWYQILPCCKKIEDGKWHLPVNSSVDLPLVYSLKAKKPVTNS
jgi:hypothetical protein